MLLQPLEQGQSLRKLNPDGQPLASGSSDLLQRLATVRNRGAHAEPLTVAEAEGLRREILGIGCEGAVVALVAPR